MPPPSRRRSDRQRGQSMLEFALVAPVLLVLAFGIFDLGRAESANVTVTNSSREGARLLVAQLTQHSHGGSAPYFGGVVDCPGGTGRAPLAPASTSAQGAAWRQMSNATLDLTQVQSLQVRVYSVAQGHDPAVGGTAADYSFSCTQPSDPTQPWTVTESGSGYPPTSGDWVQFEQVYWYHPATPVISAFLSRVTVDQVTTMVLE